MEKDTVKNNEKSNVKENKMRKYIILLLLLLLLVLTGFLSYAIYNNRQEVSKEDFEQAIESEGINEDLESNASSIDEDAEIISNVSNAQNVTNTKSGEDKTDPSNNAPTPDLDDVIINMEYIGKEIIEVGFDVETESEVVIAIFKNDLLIDYKIVENGTGTIVFNDLDAGSQYEIRAYDANANILAQENVASYTELPVDLALNIVKSYDNLVFKYEDRTAAPTYGNLTYTLNLENGLMENQSVTSENTIDEISFESLNSNTTYTYKLIGTTRYDEEVVIKSGDVLTTLQPVTVESASFAEGSYTKNDEIVLGIKLDNKDNAEVSSVNIDGVSYPVTNTTLDGVEVAIPLMEFGENTVTIEAINFLDNNGAIASSTVETQATTILAKRMPTVYMTLIVGPSESVVTADVYDPDHAITNEIHYKSVDKTTGETHGEGTLALNPDLGTYTTSAEFTNGTTNASKNNIQLSGDYTYDNVLESGTTYLTADELLVVDSFEPTVVITNEVATNNTINAYVTYLGDESAPTSDVTVTIGGTTYSETISDVGNTPVAIPVATSTHGIVSGTEYTITATAWTATDTAKITTLFDTPDVGTITPTQASYKLNEATGFNVTMDRSTATSANYPEISSFGVTYDYVSAIGTNGTPVVSPGTTTTILVGSAENEYSIAFDAFAFSQIVNISFNSFTYIDADGTEKVVDMSAAPILVDLNIIDDIPVLTGFRSTTTPQSADIEYVIEDAYNVVINEGYISMEIYHVKEADGTAIQGGYYDTTLVDSDGVPGPTPNDYMNDPICTISSNDGLDTTGIPQNMCKLEDANGQLQGTFRVEFYTYINGMPVDPPNPNTGQEHQGNHIKLGNDNIYFDANEDGNPTNDTASGIVDPVVPEFVLEPLEPLNATISVDPNFTNNSTALIEIEISVPYLDENGVQIPTRKSANGGSYTPDEFTTCDMDNSCMALANMELTLRDSTLGEIKKTFTQSSSNPAIWTAVYTGLSPTEVYSIQAVIDTATYGTDLVLTADDADPADPSSTNSVIQTVKIDGDQSFVPGLDINTVEYVSATVDTNPIIMEPGTGEEMIIPVVINNPLGLEMKDIYYTINGEPYSKQIVDSDGDATNGVVIHNIVIDLEDMTMVKPAEEENTFTIDNITFYDGSMINADKTGDGIADGNLPMHETLQISPDDSYTFIIHLNEIPVLVDYYTDFASYNEGMVAEVGVIFSNPTDSPISEVYIDGVAYDVTEVITKENEAHSSVTINIPISSAMVGTTTIGNIDGVTYTDSTGTIVTNSPLEPMAIEVSEIKGAVSIDNITAPGIYLPGSVDNNVSIEFTVSNLLMDTVGIKFTEKTDLSPITKVVDNGNGIKTITVTDVFDMPVTENLILTAEYLEYSDGRKIEIGEDVVVSTDYKPTVVSATPEFTSYNQGMNAKVDIIFNNPESSVQITSVKVGETKYTATPITPTLEEGQSAVQITVPVSTASGQTIGTITGVEYLVNGSVILKSYATGSQSNISVTGEIKPPVEVVSGSTQYEEYGYGSSINASITLNNTIGSIKEIKFSTAEVASVTTNTPNPDGTLTVDFTLPMVAPSSVAQDVTVATVTGFTYESYGGHSATTANFDLKADIYEGVVRIANCTELQNVKDNTNIANASYAYVLTQNIDCTSNQNFIPIIGFGATFDGKGYEITGYTSATNGLFGTTTSSAVIKNVNIDGTVNATASWVGLLVGQNYGLITNSSSSGMLTVENDSIGGLVGFNSSTGSVESSYSSVNVTGNNYTGGLVGYNDGDVSNSHATGTVNGGATTGGLIGYSGGEVTNSHATGAVSGITNVGGLVGHKATGLINNSYATGVVSGADSVGGLVGYQAAGSITNSYSITGTVTATNNSAGGLVGFNTGTIENSYSTMLTTGLRHVGGLVGYNATGGIISNTYATGDVHAEADAGGLVGNHEFATITSSYATGDVIGTPVSYEVGGLVGMSTFATVTNCYATGNVTAGANDSGVVKALVGRHYEATTTGSYAYGNQIINGTSVNSDNSLAGTGTSNLVAASDKLDDNQILQSDQFSYSDTKYPKVKNSVTGDDLPNQPDVAISSARDTEVEEKTTLENENINDEVIKEEDNENFDVTNDDANQNVDTEESTETDTSTEETQTEEVDSENEISFNLFNEVSFGLFDKIFNA